MNSFLHSIASVAVILLLTAAGWFFTHLGYMDERAKKFLSGFLLKICIPCMVVHNFQTSFTLEQVKESGGVICLCFGLVFILLFLSYWVAKLLHLPKNRTGVFMCMCSLSNAMFVGYPMCLELFGDACVPYVMTYYIVASVTMQVIGNSVIRWSSGSDKIVSFSAIKHFLSTPSVLAILFATLLLVLNISLPSFVLSAAKYFSSCVTSLALLLTGYIIHSIGLKNIKISRMHIAMLAFRFFAAPLLALIACRIFNITGLMRSVMVIEISMPVASQVVVFAADYGAGEDDAACGAAITTICTFLVIPILMLALNALN